MLHKAMICARPVPGMVLQCLTFISFHTKLLINLLSCAVILANFPATATTEDSQEPIERFTCLTRTNHRKTSCTNHCEGCYTGQRSKKIVLGLPQSLRKVKPSSTFRNDCGNEENTTNIRCKIFYTFWSLQDFNKFQ